MEYDKLSELRQYVNAGVIPQRWQAASLLISAERAEIIKAVFSGNAHGGAYGFTSMLGPNDHREMSPEQQQIMLAGHCVGTPSELSEPEARAILASKIIQLANGGTGMSAARYNDLLAVARQTPGSVNVDLDASYGSGDVVPAAWWVKSIWGESTNWQAGDLIALINGNFVSNAFSYLVFDKLLNTVAAFVNLTAETHKQFISGATGNLLDFKLNALYVNHTGWDSPPQLPVSQRDIFPILHSASSNLYRFAEALESSLAAKSGNPIFIKEQGRVVAKSQSSFLNLELSGGLHAINSTVAQLSAATQRATEIVCSKLLQDADDFTTQILQAVQLPKVSEAYKLQIATPLLVNYSGSMSGGVEDLWDLNLPNSRELLRKLNILEKQLDTLKTATEHAGIDVGQQVTAKHLWESIIAN